MGGRQQDRRLYWDSGLDQRRLVVALGTNKLHGTTLPMTDSSWPTLTQRQQVCSDGKQRPVAAAAAAAARRLLLLLLQLQYVQQALEAGVHAVQRLAQRGLQVG